MTPFSPYVGQKASMVMTADGTVLQATNETALCHPASLTKLGTAIMAFRALKEGRIHLDTMLTASENAEKTERTKLGLKQGMQISVADAISALFVVSANDAALTLAEALGGNEAEFARQMTDYVHSLGLSQTVFRNASGLPDPEQVSTAQDMADLMAITLHDYPEFQHFMQMTELTYDGTTYFGHNKFLKRFPGADGKTGFTNASGNNLLVSILHDDAPRVIAVIFGVKGAQRASDLLARNIEKSLGEYKKARAQPVIARTDRLALNP